MTRKGNIQWLLNELPGLVGQGLLSPEQAEKFRRHYGASAASSGRRWLLALFSILGAVLVGAGIILLLAHNWEQLSRPVRAGVSFALLLLGQMAAGRAILRPAPSGSLREGTSAFLMLAVGASLALIAQTYHLAADAETFTLTWMLLGLPLVYTHGAVVPALCYLAGISTWTMMTIETVGPSYYWLLMALLAPYIAQLFRRNRFQARAAVLLWGAAISFLVVCGATTASIEEDHLLLLYAQLCAVFYLADAFWFEEAPTAWQRPLKLLGAGGIALMAFVLSFEDAGSFPPHAYFNLVREGVAGILLGAGLPLMTLALLVLAVLRRRFGALAFGVFPLLVWIGPMLGQGMTWLYVNAYLFGLGLFVLVAGARARQIGKVNGGMLMLGGLIVARFFDWDVSFIVKGVTFILLGLGFLAANVVMLRRKGGAS